MSSIGEAIETARRAKGMSQEDLATRAGVTQAALSRYENDLREPDNDTVAALAKALGVTPRLLQRAGRLEGAMAVDAHMRRHATAKAGQWRQLEAQLNMYRMHTKQLLEEISMRAELSIPTFDPIDTEPADAARMVRMQWRLPMGPVRNLTRWLEAAGCIIIERDFDTARVDGLSQWIDGRGVIMVNTQSPADRRRLTLAHELGHLCLHTREITDTVEDDANRFAAELLMPADVIAPQLRNLTIGKLYDLKRAWGVSMQALIERAFHLGLLAPAQRTAFYKQFSHRGWRKHEPLSDEMTVEHPELPTVVAESLISRGWTQSDIDAVAGFDIDANEWHPFRAPTKSAHLRRV